MEIQYQWSDSRSHRPIEHSYLDPSCSSKIEQDQCQTRPEVVVPQWLITGNFIQSKLIIWWSATFVSMSGLHAKGGLLDVRSVEGLESHGNKFLIESIDPSQNSGVGVFQSSIFHEKKRKNWIKLLPSPNTTIRNSRRKESRISARRTLRYSSNRRKNLPKWLEARRTKQAEITEELKRRTKTISHTLLLSFWDLLPVSDPKACLNTYWRLIFGSALDLTLVSFTHCYTNWLLPDTSECGEIAKAGHIMSQPTSRRRCSNLSSRFTVSTGEFISLLTPNDLF